MTTTLDQGQAELPRLVELASKGEDIVITVDGKPRARLTRAISVSLPTLAPADLQAWMAELAELRRGLWMGNTVPSAEQLVAEDRAES